MQQRKWQSSRIEREQAMLGEEGSSGVFKPNGAHQTRASSPDEWLEGGYLRGFDLAAHDLGFWTVDVASRTVTTCERYRQMLGRLPGDPVRNRDEWRACVHPEDRDQLDGMFEPVAAGIADEVYAVYRINGPDGKQRRVASRGHVLRDSQGAPVSIVGVAYVSDQPSSLDDQLRASEQRRSALEQEVRRKDEFLATLSHELRSPLGAIRHALGVLQPALAAEPTLASTAGVIERQVRDLCRLTDDLLDLSRIAEGKARFETEAVDLARIIEHAIEASYPLLERRGQRLRVDLPARPLELWGDGSRLVQVFTNLLNNASTYSGEGTHVAVGVEEESDEVIVRIRDGGIGLSAEMLPRVFEPFFQADPARAGRHGLGVGLHLVRQFVQMHGGIVSASSGGVGQGTEFVVRLPLIRPPAAEAQPPGPPVTSKKGMAMDDIGERPEDMRYTGPPLGILVIDDHEDGGSMFGLLLRSMGHDAKVMTSAANLLAEARAFQPDAIFLDLSMPGIDGYEAARTLRQEADLKNVYLVAHSAYGRAEDIEDCRNAGFDVHLLKPTRADRLQSVIAEVARRV